MLKSLLRVESTFGAWLRSWFRSSAPGVGIAEEVTDTGGARTRGRGVKTENARVLLYLALTSRDLSTQRFLLGLPSGPLSHRFGSCAGVWVRLRVDGVLPGTHGS